MHNDSATIVGLKHARSARPSEDFVLSGSMRAGMHWAIVSDGCSGGGRTDLGAQAWSMALQRRLCAPGGVAKALDHPRGFQELLLVQAEPFLEPLMPAERLATLGAVVADEERCGAIVAGDGVVVACFRDGGIEAIACEFSRNMPLYPAYFEDPQDFRCFVEDSRRRDNALVVREFRSLPGGSGAFGPPSHRQEALSLETPMFQVIDFTARRTELAALLVATDGLFSRPGCHDTPSQVASFKSWPGRFLERRLSACVRSWSENRSLPEDDLSVAGVCFIDDVVFEG